MSKTDVLHLIDKFLAGEASSSETELLLNAYETFQQEKEWHEAELGSKEELEQKILNRLKESLNANTSKEKETHVYELPGTSRPRRLILRWLSAAAAVLLLVSSGMYLYNSRIISNNKIAVDPSKSLDILPGKQGAVLTLADGTQIVLDSLNSGIIANQQGTNVLLADGELQYKTADQSPAEAVAYNTMQTPRGRQFQLVLPDGTHVWLNAASSIKYPTAFTEKQRKVTIEGEVYFEVAKNKAMPFLVDVAGQTTIEVLGTHFNVNAYTNEHKIVTTLLEGSIQTWANPAQPLTLKPGQQAQWKSIGEDRSMMLAHEVDLEKVMAWKNGQFNFEDASLKEVMGQLERWYDIQVVYESGIPDMHFGGGMSMDMNLSAVLKVLQKAKVKFRMEEERKLIVIP